MRLTYRGVRLRILAIPRSEILAVKRDVKKTLLAEISVNDGRSLALSHIIKDGVADLLWVNTAPLNAGGEVGGEKILQL